MGTTDNARRIRYSLTLAHGKVLYLSLFGFLASLGIAEELPPYRVTFKNHEVVAGKQIKNWDRLGKSPNLDGRPLFTPQNPVRLYQNLSVSRPQDPVPPYIQMCNGDILPGRVVTMVPTNTKNGLPEHAVVELRDRVAPWKLQASAVRIRTDRIKRVVHEETSAGEADTGLLVFLDKKTISFKSHRWTTDGVRVLNDELSARASWNEIAEFRLPAQNRLSIMQAILDDLLAPCPDPKSRIGRMTTDDGAVMTFRQAMWVPEYRDNNVLFHGIQPTWSLDMLRVAFDKIAMVSFRDANQIPLSILPSTTISQRNMTGFTWHWQQDRSIRKQLLSSGRQVSDFGIGSHSFSEIQFLLPPGVHSFSALVGVDQRTDRGGCVQCRLHKAGDQIDPNPIWKSDFLRGRQEPVALTVPLAAAKQLVLVTDFGHDGRPPGSDPYDIRDEVDWLIPLVLVDAAAIREHDLGTMYRMPMLAGWTIPKADLDLFSIGVWWDPKAGRWWQSLEPKQEATYQANQVVLHLEKTWTVSERNNWLPISVTGSGAGKNPLLARVMVNGEPVASVKNSVASASGSAGDFASRAWNLHAFMDQEITLTAQIVLPNAGKYRMHGITFGEFNVVPLIQSLSNTGQAMVPEVPLSSLKPVAFSIPGRDDLPPVGKVDEKTPLAIATATFDDGYCLPADSKLTYAVEPDYRRFQAVLGMTSGNLARIGPVEIVVDEELIWTSKSVISDHGRFWKNTRAFQLDLEIPMGATSLQIKTGSGSSSLTLAHPGFAKN